MGIDKYLKYKGLNFRERMNIYGGISLGVLTPIIAMRYGAFKEAKPEGLFEEAVVWGLSAFMTIPFQPTTFLVGLCIGNVNANQLMKERLELQRNNLEYKLNDGVRKNAIS